MSDIPKQIEQVNVSLDVVWQGSGGKHDARISEISVNGCFIDSMGQEILGETIYFKVHLPSGPWINLEGKVIYQEYPIGFELQFTDLTEENHRLILEAVAAHGGKEAQQKLKELETKPPQQISWTAKHRVLLADDDSMTLRMLEIIAEAQDYEVLTAKDGREAFTILHHDSHFSAVIFDMMMPHLLGMDLIHYMKTDVRLRNIPIGMVTAEQDPKIWDDSVAAGANVFLPKPFSPPQVQMMLRMLINKNRF